NENGPIGVAPKVSLYAANVIGPNSNTRLLGGIQWAVTTGARVISMSVGVFGYKPYLEPVFNTIRQSGILPIVAIGNEGPDTSRSPGNYATALSVGAVDIHGQVWPDSASQTFLRQSDPIVPDVVAPGVNISSTRRGGGLEARTGTSQATPFVTGLAAL